MNDLPLNDPGLIDQIIEPVGYDFGLSRRHFVQALGAGLLIATATPDLLAQSRPAGQQRERGRGRGDSRPIPVEARVHIGKDGTITVMTGKVECGQGARAQITQAAAEELRVASESIKLLMADTELCPDDGITAGSRTSPSTLPAVRRGCAAARGMLIKWAGQQWNVEPGAIEMREGAAFHAASGKKMSYAEFASADAESLKQMVPGDVAVTAVADWKAMGKSAARPNARDIVTGGHDYPSDVVRPGMLYGKVLRPPTYRAKLTDVNPDAAKSIDGVVAVRDGDFAGVAAPSTYVAKQAIKAMEESAKWEAPPHPSSKEVYDYLREKARGGVPANPFADEVSAAAKLLRATYHIPYVQHAPLEPRAAVAEWQDGKLTVWTSSQNPFGVRRELANAFHIEENKVRVIIPDFGGGFGGRHTGETAVEAARLAKVAGKPVALRWTRAEEFTFAAFRPAAVIDVEATLAGDGTITSWHFVNINAGGSGIDMPYRTKANTQSVNSEAVLRHGSYRALASTGNNFARESMMDDLAAAAGRGPLEFRVAHLENDRLRAVLEAAAKRFGWEDRKAAETPFGSEPQGRRQATAGVGLACGTEKGSYVAACAEIEIDAKKTIRVRRVCQAFECGAITTPQNLRSQVIGAIVMGLGPALREATEFDGGKMLNASFWKYEVPRLADLPPIEIELLDRPDLPSAGAGETPLIAIAPAIANAVFQATGQRLTSLPLKLA